MERLKRTKRLKRGSLELEALVNKASAHIVIQQTFNACTLFLTFFQVG